jgi:hypothetical protein
MKCLDRQSKSLRVTIIAQAVLSSFMLWPMLGLWWALAVFAAHILISKPFSHICAYMYEDDAAFYKKHGHCPCKDCCEKHGTKQADNPSGQTGRTTPEN